MTLIYSKKGRNVWTTLPSAHFQLIGLHSERLKNPEGWGVKMRYIENNIRSFFLQTLIF